MLKIFFPFVKRFYQKKNNIFSYKINNLNTLLSCNFLKNICIVIFSTLLLFFVTCGCNKHQPKWPIAKDFHFEQLHNSTNPRGFHSAITMKNGKVLLVGNNQYLDIWGYKNKTIPNTDYLQIADVYDPTSKTFKYIKMHKYIFENPTLINLPDGKVLIINENPSEKDFKNMFVFDPEKNTTKIVDQLIPMTKDAVLLNNGTILFSNGEVNKIYNPKTWKLLKTLNIKDLINFKILSLLPDGRIIFIKNKEIKTLNPETGNIENHGNTTLLATDHLLYKTKLFTIGYVNNSKTEDEVDQLRVKLKGFPIEVYDFQTKQRKIIDSRIRVPNATSIVLKDGRILRYQTAYGIPPKRFFFDVDYCTDKNKWLHPDIEIFNPVTNTSSIVINNSTDLRKDLQLTLLQDGNVLISGGMAADPCLSSSDNLALKSAELIVFSKNKE